MVPPVTAIVATGTKLDIGSASIAWVEARPTLQFWIALLVIA